jgi:hypothetical protein
MNIFKTISKNNQQYFMEKTLHFTYFPFTFFFFFEAKVITAEEMM